MSPALSAARDLEPALLDPVLGPVLDDRSPWRVVVVGRRSTGKTTLVNRLAGTALPTGLGGVTEVAHEVLVGDVVLVDTPPMEEAPDLSAADAVIWMVDGLQPLTRSEREQMARACPVGTALRVVVARIDLVDPTDRPSVEARVASLTDRWRADVRTANLRRDPPDPTWITPDPPSLRRLWMLERAATEAIAVIDAHPLPGPDAWRATTLSSWRDFVRSVREETAEAVLTGHIELRGEAERHLRDLAAERLPAFLAEQGFSPDALPLPETEARARIDLGGGLGGAGAALRHVDRRAARWAMDGDLALLDLLDKGPRDGGAWSRRKRARDLAVEAISTCQTTRAGRGSTVLP